MKKIVFLLILLSFTTLSAQMYNDISKEHWAYRAIKNLYMKGILPKGPSNFDGEKLITKYDLVEYLSKTLNEVDETKASQSDLVILEQLVSDFSDELNKVGFKTDIYIKKSKDMSETIETLKKQVSANQLEIEKLTKAIK